MFPLHLDHVSLLVVEGWREVSNANGRLSSRHNPNPRTRFNLPSSKTESCSRPTPDSIDDCDFYRLRWLLLSRIKPPRVEYYTCLSPDFEPHGWSKSCTAGTRRTELPPSRLPLLARLQSNAFPRNGAMSLEMYLKTIHCRRSGSLYCYSISPLDFAPHTGERSRAYMQLEDLLRSRLPAVSFSIMHLASAAQREALRRRSVMHLKLGIFRRCPWSRYLRAKTR